MPNVPLEAVLATHELELRPFREPDYAGENVALRELMAIYGERPEAIRQRLVEIVADRCGGDGAGLSVLETGADGVENLRWLATAGTFAIAQGTTVARSVSPGNTVISEQATQLFAQPGRLFPIMEDPIRTVYEEMIAPFWQDGKVVGTLWVLTHDEHRHFDSEDRRMLESLTLFASMAWQRHLSEAAAREAVERTNAELEIQVARRTEDLVSKNQELEGFTYSVSHDMRAPLRAIVSNATLVLQDEGPRVSFEGQERLERLKGAAKRMAQLLDDLLRYARLGTREVRLERVDLSALARNVASEVDLVQMDCCSAVEIDSGMEALCDPRLIGMAIQNLLENACKYSKPGGCAQIQFGSTERDGERVFFVKDDGIGFDMAFVGKLFQPFERLHREEYSGTGIGLANVKRAVERHGGRVWAEGSPGNGATFYFTLG